MTSKWLEGLGFNLCIVPFLNICVPNFKLESLWSELSELAGGWSEVGQGWSEGSEVWKCQAEDDVGCI